MLVQLHFAVSVVAVWCREGIDSSPMVRGLTGHSLSLRRAFAALVMLAFVLQGAVLSSHFHAGLGVDIALGVTSPNDKSDPSAPLPLANDECPVCSVAPAATFVAPSTFVYALAIGTHVAATAFSQAVITSRPHDAWQSRAPPRV